MTFKPFANVRTRCSAAPAEPGRAAAWSGAPCHRPSRSGWPARTNRIANPADSGDREERAPQAGRPSDVHAGEWQGDRKQQQDRGQIEQPLDDDGGKRRRRREALRGAPAGMGADTSPMRAGNRNVAMKPITVVRNAGTESRVAERLQQRQPAPGAQHVRHEDRGDRDQNQAPVGPRDRRGRFPGGPDRGRTTRATQWSGPRWQAYASESLNGWAGWARLTCGRHRPQTFSFYYKIGGKSMGKRELLIAAAFLFVGLVAYQVAAPPAEGGRTRVLADPNVLGNAARNPRQSQQRHRQSRPARCPSPRRSPSSGWHQGAPSS